MSDNLVFLHNLLRWLILSLGVLGLASALWEGSGSSVSRTVSRMFLGILDLQFLLGVVVLVMSRSEWLHAGIMLVAVVLAHVLSIRARNSPPELVRGSRIAVFTVPMIVMFLGIGLVD